MYVRVCIFSGPFGALAHWIGHVYDFVLLSSWLNVNEKSAQNIAIVTKWQKSTSTNHLSLSYAPSLSLPLSLANIVFNYECQLQILHIAQLK